eukprot:1077068-Rhodomonas_salina.1
MVIARGIAAVSDLLTPHSQPGKGCASLDDISALSTCGVTHDTNLGSAAGHGVPHNTSKLRIVAQGDRRAGADATSLGWVAGG